MRDGAGLACAEAHPTDAAVIGQGGVLSAGTAGEDTTGGTAELRAPVQGEHGKDETATMLTELFSTRPVL